MPVAISAASRFLLCATFLALLGGTPAQAAVTLFTDAAAFQAALDSTSGEIEVLVTDAAGVGLALETGPPGPNTVISPGLTFLRENTALSRSFAVTPAIEFTFDDDEGDPLPNFDNALSIGDINGRGTSNPAFENDDWLLTVTAGAPLRAFGFTLRDNNASAGETLSLQDASGRVLAVVPLDGVTAVNTFVGVITDFDFSRVFYDEDPGGDDIAIADFTFQVASPVSLERITSTEADGPSDVPFAAISPDARHVLFTTRARNLTSGSQNSAEKVLQWDRSEQSFRRRSGLLAQAGDLSDNGDFVTYTRMSEGAVVFDRDGDPIVIGQSAVPASEEGEPRRNPGPRMDATGRYVVFEDLRADGSAGILLVDTDTLDSEVIDVAVDGGVADGSSERPDISEDGRYVIFLSDAGNLVPRDSNGLTDVFVRDRMRGETWRVNLTPQGGQTTDTSDGGAKYRYPAISLDGRFVLFWSQSRELVEDADPDPAWRLYLRDQAAGETRVIATSRRDVNRPTISAGGRYVAFVAPDTGLVTDPSGLPQAFVYDTAQNTYTMLSRNPRYGEPGNQEATFAQVSADGRAVLFASRADNLGDVDRNRVADLFLAPLPEAGDPGYIDTQTLEAQNVGAGGITLSVDGRYVAYTRSEPSAVVVRDLQTDATSIESIDPSGQPFASAREPELSANANRIGLTGLVAGGTEDQVYVRFRATQQTRLASVSPGDEPGNATSEEPRLCADADLVAYVSQATNLGPQATADEWQVYVHNFGTGLNTRVSETAQGVRAAGGVDRRTIGFSENCRYVVFQSDATNLAGIPVPADTQQVYLKDRTSGALTLISKDASGAALEDPALLGELPISADGRYVVFIVDGTTALGPGGAYRYDRDTNRATFIGHANVDQTVTMSRDGRFVLYEDEQNLLQLVDMATGQTSLVGRQANGNPLDIGQYVVNVTGNTVFEAQGALYLQRPTAPWVRPGTCDDCAGSVLLRILPALSR